MLEDEDLMATGDLSQNYGAKGSTANRNLFSSVVEDFFNIYGSGTQLKKQNKCIISQNNRYKMLWDLWILFLLLIISIIVPIRLAFVEQETKEWFIFYIMTDSFFFIDIILTFFTTISDDQKVYEITDRRVIARKYLKGWFIVDILSILPIDIILIGTGEATVLARFAKIGKLYKLIRMIRLAKVLKLLKSKNTVMT